MICCLWKSKEATGLGFGTEDVDEDEGFQDRRSHTAQTPSSAPEARRWVVCLDQDITLTSVSLIWTLMAAVRDLLRMSHTLIVPSLEADAKTFFSEGLHCSSSTLPVWPVKGRSSVDQPPPALWVVTNIRPSLSPVMSLPVGEREDQSRA